MFVLWSLISVLSDVCGDEDATEVLWSVSCDIDDVLWFLIVKLSGVCGEGDAVEGRPSEPPLGGKCLVSCRLDSPIFPWWFLVGVFSGDCDEEDTVVMPLSVRSEILLLLVEAACALKGDKFGS
jgi:hypothetical protein